MSRWRNCLIKYFVRYLPPHTEPPDKAWWRDIVNSIHSRDTLCFRLLLASPIAYKWINHTGKTAFNIIMPANHQRPSFRISTRSCDVFNYPLLSPRQVFQRFNWIRRWMRSEAVCISAFILTTCARRRRVITSYNYISRCNGVPYMENCGELLQNALLLRL